MTAPGALHAFTDGSSDMRVLALSQAAVDAFHELPPLPPSSADDPNFIPPAIYVIDHATDRLVELSRWWCGAGRGCAAWVEDVTDD